MPREPSYFDHLSQLVQMERAFQQREDAKAFQELTAPELQARGLCLLDVEAVEEDFGLGGRILVSLAPIKGALLPFRPNPGTPVEVRPRKSETGTARAIVSQASARRVQLSFDEPPPQFVYDGRLRVDVIPDDVTFTRALSAIDRWRQTEHGIERRRREVLLGNGPAQSDVPRELQASRELNPEQQQAVSRALAAEDFFLVHGPPGTGKSTVLAEVAVQSARAGRRVLATAASNAAVDHLLELCLSSGLQALRIGHPARVSPALRAHTLDAAVENHPDRVIASELFEEAFELLGHARRQRKQGRSRERFARARESTGEARRMMDDARELERKAIRSVLDGSQVLCATLSSLDGGHLASQSFDIAVFDEATQAIEPLSLIAFLKAPRVVMAGDHRQLPPTVRSPEAASGGLSISLFERLLGDHGDAVKLMLREQYRMHEQIMAFPSEEMYAGELRAHPSVAHRMLADILSQPLDAPPVLFLDTAGRGFDESLDESSRSYRNEGEATLIVARALQLIEAGLPASEIAVIAPYRAQVLLLRETLPNPDVEVDTVDSFQGREKEAVLVSLTRSNSEGQLGFLSDLRRMNVAITRARRHLFATGDSATLASHPFFSRFIERADRQGGYRSCWEWPGPPVSCIK